MFKTKTTAVLYHKDADGFGAAFAAWTYFGDSAYYIPVQYGEAVPDIPGEVTYLYIVDFCYSEKELEELDERFKKVVVIDHHKTAKDIVLQRDGSVFDLNHSGAVLTHNYFFGNTRDVPTILLYVEDRDLWRFHLPYSEAVNAYIYTIPEDFERWNEFNLNTAIESGMAILAYRDKIIDLAVKSAKLIVFDGIVTPVVNTTALASEIGNELCKHYDTVMSITYCDRVKSGVRTFSLRSVGDFDVSVVAKRHGGGGHKNAAGFSQPINMIGVTI